MNTDFQLIDSIRASSRHIVRELGFMEPTLATTEYSASAIHALLELNIHGSLTPTELVQLLGLEKSSVSRLLSKLVKAGELKEEPSTVDSRVKKFTLSEKGINTVEKIESFGRHQVLNAFKYLSESEKLAVSDGLLSYAHALQKHRTGATSNHKDQIEIMKGYRAGLVGRVTEMHAEFYSKHYNFGQFFESQVATGLSEFVGRLQEPKNQVWTAIADNRIVGTVTIDGQDLGGDTAHLRWFIIDERYQGYGAGRKLLSKAIAFIDTHNFKETLLWTFKGLDSARCLYESMGFELVSEQEGSQWGDVVMEQKFIRHQASI